MDLRVHHIFHEHMKDDKSFLEKDHPLQIIFGRNKYTKMDMRETFHRGVRLGIDIGLNESSPQGQRIQLDTNTDPKHRPFLEKMYALCEQYQCSIEYHPEIGMVVLDKNYHEF